MIDLNSGNVSEKFGTSNVLLFFSVMRWRDRRHSAALVGRPLLHHTGQHQAEEDGLRDWMRLSRMNC